MDQLKKKYQNLHNVKVKSKNKKKLRELSNCVSIIVVIIVVVNFFT